MARNELSALPGELSTDAHPAVNSVDVFCQELGICRFFFWLFFGGIRLWIEPVRYGEESYVK